MLQPTHLLHGEEFEQKILSLRDKFTAKFQKIIISQPLIVNDEDYRLAGGALGGLGPPSSPWQQPLLPFRFLP